MSFIRVFYTTDHMSLLLLYEPQFTTTCSFFVSDKFHSFQFTANVRVPYFKQLGMKINFIFKHNIEPLDV